MGSIRVRCKRVFSRIWNKYHALVFYSGNYSNWDEVAQKCRGYDDEAIFEKVKRAALEVVAGRACYEQDSWLFYTRKYNYPLISYINYFFLLNGHLQKRIVDWGGSLGSTYYQNREFWNRQQINYQWIVVEQPHFVEFGKEKISDSFLSFMHINEIEVNNNDIVLMSSVLQYIPDYKDVLKQILDMQPLGVILERTPVGKRERIVMEKIKEPIYNADYPARLLCEDDLVSYIEKFGYELLDDWKSQVDSDIELDRKSVV